MSDSNDKPRCPNCKKAVKGLFEDLSREAKKSYRYERRAWYCKYCKLVWKDNEVLIMKIIYESVEALDADEEI